jgi:hypothetical protein
MSSYNKGNLVKNTNYSEPQIKNTDKKYKEKEEDKFLATINKYINEIDQEVSKNNSSTIRFKTIKNTKLTENHPSVIKTNLEKQIEFFKGLINTPEGKKQLMALRRYSFGYDGIINIFLRSKVKDSTEFTKLINDLRKHEKQDIRGKLIGYSNGGFKNLILDLVENIDEAFKNVPQLSKPIRVYRGQDTDTFIGKELIFDSYMSTTHDLNTAFIYIDNECCIYVLDIQPGVKVLPIKYISRFLDEEELLIERNCNIVIDSVKYLITSTGEIVSEKPTVNSIQIKYCKVYPPPRN